MDGLRPVWAVKVIVLIIITSIFFRCVWGTNHSVGGGSGWDLSSNLQAWSSATTFHVGDFLVFRYLPLHDVLEVNQIDYIMCRTTNPIKAYTDGESVIRLHEPGMRYFICGRLRHCFMGLKLQVRILESDTKNNSTDGGGDQEQDGGGNNHMYSPPPSDHAPPSTGTPGEPPPAPDIPGEPPHPCCSGVGDLIVSGNVTKWWWVICITLVIFRVSSRSPQMLRLSIASSFSDLCMQTATKPQGYVNGCSDQGLPPANNS